MINFRKLQLDDICLLNEIRNIYANDYLHDNRTFTVDQSIAWFKNNNPDYYAILLNEKMIGYFRLSNYSVQNRNIYLGADIHPEFSGRGYATEAYKKFIPFLFKEYYLNKISLEVLSTNERAIHLYKKLGFVFEGTKRKEILKNGSWIDSVMMSMLREEHEKFKI